MVRQSCAGRHGDRLGSWGRGCSQAKVGLSTCNQEDTSSWDDHWSMKQRYDAYIRSTPGDWCAQGPALCCRHHARVTSATMQGWLNSDVFQRLSTLRHDQVSVVQQQYGSLRQIWQTMVIGIFLFLMMQGNLGNWKYTTKRAMEIEFPLKICRQIWKLMPLGPLKCFWCKVHLDKTNFFSPFSHDFQLGRLLYLWIDRFRN